MSNKKLELLRDENGVVLVPPARILASRRPRPTSASEENSSLLVVKKPSESLISAQILACLIALLGVRGGLPIRLPASLSLQSPEVGARSVYDPPHLDQLSQGVHETQSKDEIVHRLARLDQPLVSHRRNPRGAQPWEKAYGSEKSLHKQAKYHLRSIDHEQMELFDPPVIVLAKTVCNLRNYLARSRAQTIKLIQCVYNPRCGIKWSEEDIGLLWDLIERFVPSLWLTDERHLSPQRTARVQREVRGVLDRLTPGGKIPVKKMQQLLADWDPDLRATPRELGLAMKALTGEASKSSNGVSYYPGFQLPFDDDFSVEIPDAFDEMMARWKKSGLPGQELQSLVPFIKE